ncbi:unnamed protein product [Brassicogethes aeneus]|uniref:Uncharacterized protein n=1 Tax=Brassicogethes aeneus TaxID=1431903 RepID=A0A9P0B2C7_BRAAE|nr:unnamed protein product [Brassicogethes aeneus]
MVGKTKIPLKTASEKVETADVEVKKRGRSPGRKSPSRTKSPSRAEKKSPVINKSPARNRSPGRVKKAESPSRSSPSRRSPARQSSKSQEEPKSVSRRKQIVIDSEEDSDYVEPTKEVKEKPKATVRGRTRRIDIEIEPVKIFDSIKDLGSDDETTSFVSSSSSAKRVTRSQNRDVERVVHLKHFEAVSKKLGEFSDEDDVSDIKKASDLLNISGGKKSRDFSGALGALAFVLLIPAAVVLLNSCEGISCSFKRTPAMDKLKFLITWFDLKASLVYVAFLTVMAVLTALPFGGKRISGLPNKQGKLDYNINSLFTFAIVLSIEIGLQLRNIPVLNYIIDHTFHFLIASIASALVISLYAYIRSFYVSVSALNINSVGRSRLYSFFVGKETSPRIFGIIDLKLYVTRISVIGTLLINTAYLCKSLGVLSPLPKNENGTQQAFDIKSLNYDPTVLVYFALTTVYLLDYLFAEQTSISSYKIHHSGFGYAAAIGSLLYPFVFAPVIRHIVYLNVKHNVWVLSTISLVFLIGYIFYRVSNNQKHAFKKNPYSPAVAHFDTIPTAQGNKLLASGFWGIVRHPNYLGDILMNLSLGAFVLSVPLALGILGIVLNLIYKSARDNSRCQQKYGAAWDRYCLKVKNILVPKIF